MSVALSYSRWKDADCPHRFNVLHIEKSYKEPESEPMRLGSEVHKITENYRRHCFARGLQSDIDWLQKSMETASGDDARRLIENFISSPAVTLPVGASEWVQVEGRFTFGNNLVLLDEDAWFDNSRAKFRMVLDFSYKQGDTLYLIDDKTGLGEPDPLQLELYAYLSLQAYLSRHGNGDAPIKRIVCVFNELAKRTTPSWEYVPSDVSGVRKKIFDRLDLVSGWKEFPATACGQCKWCSVPGCSIRGGVVQAVVEAPGSPVNAVPEVISTREEAEQAVMFLLFAEQLADGVKELIRSYVEANGPVLAGGKVAELRENNPWKVKDLEKLVKAMAAYGVPAKEIWGNLSLSESGLEKACKKAKIQERLPMLLAMGERKAYKPRFGLFNDTV